jgi:hypothetical protein
MYQVLSRQGVHKVLGLLDELDRWIDEVPPLPTPQRFGNLAFRTWGERLEQVFLPIPLFDICTT